MRFAGQRSTPRSGIRLQASLWVSGARRISTGARSSRTWRLCCQISRILYSRMWQRPRRVPYLQSKDNYPGARQKMANEVFDVLIVGSGHAGGMAAKILTEAGASCLMLNAGPVADANRYGERKHAYSSHRLGF